MATEVEAGDLVQAAGNAGPWTVVDIRQGMALLEHADGHKLSRRTTTLTVVRKGSGKKSVATDPDSGEAVSPTLFD